jgi:uncharacterized protein involved in type VI secretion and phage assembly
MRPGGPRKESLDALQFGLHYAIVCQNKDDEQKLDRVKVRLPWLDGGDTDQTHWAQLLTPMAGKNFGMHTMPDVDDVVVVMFIAGDISQPVVIGGVHSKADNCPEPNDDGKNNFRGYRSRSGARLILDDSKKTKVVLADKTGKNVVGVGQFDSDGSGPNKSSSYKPPMSGDHGCAIATMEGKLNLTCKNGKLTVTAQGDIKINAKTTIDMKAQGDLSMDGSSAAKLTSGSPSNYDAPKIDIA